jgi:tetratricopeptide (TPR) repeat protein/O-antigen ligase
VLLGTALPLARGGVDWPVQYLALIVASVALVLTSTEKRLETPIFVLGLAGVTVFVALQLVPLPPFLQRLASPGAVRLFDFALRPIGIYPASRPLSLDPSSTGRELGKAAACLFAAAVAARFSGSRHRQDLLFGALSLGGTATAAAGIAGALGGVGPLLEPKLVFVNPNHLAGFLNLTSFIALGFALRSYGRARLLWLMAFAVAGAGVFLSLSRGGMAAFFVGAGVFAALHARRNRPGPSSSAARRFTSVSVAIAVVLAVTAYVALDPVVAELRTVKTAAQDVKLALVPAGLRMVRDFPIAGIGRGAFTTVFTAYRSVNDSVTFTHLENEWIQALVDLGIPVGLLLVASVVFTWCAAARCRDLSRPEIGALAGLSALAAQNLVDFSLEVLGVAVPAALLLGLLSRAQRSVTIGRAWILPGVTTILALAVVGLWLHRDHSIEADAERVSVASNTEEMLRQAAKAVRWHPADYLPQALAGARLVQEGRCAEAMPWLSRSMWLNQNAPEPHRYAGRCLAAAHQAPLAKREYRLAVLMGDWSALSEAVERYPALADLLEIAPDGPDALLSLGWILSTKREADAEKVFQRVWKDFRDPRALGLLARVILAQDRPEQALAVARTLEHERPGEPGGYLAASAALVKLGRADESGQELRLGASRLPGSLPILAALVEQALTVRHYSEARRLAAEMVAHDGPDLAGKHLVIARVLWAEGRSSEAIEEARAARSVTPLEPAIYVTIADYYQMAGRYEEAIAALRGAAALPAAPPGLFLDRLAELESLRKQQRNRVMRQQLLDDSRPASSP